jgi:hypothetical protein
MTSVENLPPVKRHRWQIATGVNDTAIQFATVISDTSGTIGKFTASVVDSGGAP